MLFSDPPPVAMEIDIKPGGDADAGSDDSPAGIIFFSLNLNIKNFKLKVFCVLHFTTK